MMRREQTFSLRCGAGDAFILCFSPTPHEISRAGLIVLDALADTGQMAIFAAGCWEDYLMSSFRRDFRGHARLMLLQISKR